MQAVFIWQVALGLKYSTFSPQQKLAVVARDFPPDGKDFARWVKWSMQNGRGEAALLDVVTEYVRNPSAISKGLDFDYFSWQRTSENLKSLWELVPKTPLSVAARLLDHLPVIDYESFARRRVCSVGSKII
jgi:hypothetical protein